LRWAGLREERPRWRFNAAYGVTDRLLIGLEFNPVVEEFVPTLNYTLQFEDETHPLVNFGTSSDRIFSPEGTRAYFLTVGKKVHGTSLAPYLSLSWSEWEDQFLIPFGVNAPLAPAWDLMVQNDGRNTHWLLTYKQSNGNLSLLLVKGRYWGTSWGVKF
jgi:hypothetical protein